jgi:hypothetical protein
VLPNKNNLELLGEVGDFNYLYSMKKCSKCQETKELTEFCKDKSRKDGLQTKCKSCFKIIWSLYYPNNKEKCKIYSNWYRNNKEDYKEDYKRWRKNRLNSIEPGVYMFTCLVNGKRYIGESNQPQRRKSEHLYSIAYGNLLSNKLMKEDMLQYGIDKFKFEILETTPNHKEQEQYWINKLKPEYNA